MKKILLLFTLIWILPKGNSQELSFQQFYFTVGAQVGIDHDKDMDDWAAYHSTTLANIAGAGYSKAVTVPSMTVGPTLGFVMFTDHWLMGGTIVWNQFSNRNSFTDQNGTVEDRKFKLKYNHWEFPFFYFPGNSPLGFGLTMDAGYHKMVEYRTKDEGSGFEMQGSQHLKQLQLGSKLGVYFFKTTSEKMAISGMAYYLIGLFGGEMEGTNGSIRPNQLGFRLQLAFAPED